MHNKQSDIIDNSIHYIYINEPKLQLETLCDQVIIDFVMKNVKINKKIFYNMLTTTMLNVLLTLI